MQDDTNSTAPADASVDAPPPRKFAGGLNRYAPYRSKLDDMLRDEHRSTYEDMLVRRTTIPKLLKWLHERDYDIGHEAVRSHRKKFLQDFGAVRHGAGVAAQFARVARAAGLTLPEASIGGLHQMLMQFFTRQNEGATAASPKDVQTLAVAVESFVDLSQKFERIRRELVKPFDDGSSDPHDHGAVVERVREILGVNVK